MEIALIILAITNIGTLGTFAWHIYLTSQERAKTTNALIARNSQEYVNHEMADKLKPLKVEKQEDLREDIQAIADLTDTEFDENLLK